MSTLYKKIYEFFLYKRTIRELYSLSDRELKDIGVNRCEIPTRIKQIHG